MDTASIKGNIYIACSQLFKLIIGLIKKDNKLLLFSSWFGTKYNDNAKYLFEYMRTNSDYNVYWFTKSKSLYRELRSKRIPVVYSSSIKGLWYHCRAIMLVSTVQTSDYIWFLLNKCIILDLGHDFPGKPVGILEPNVSEWQRKIYKQSLNGVLFYKLAPSYFAVKFWGPCFDLSDNQFVFSNVPRIDVLFDESLKTGINDYIQTIKSNHKLISYLPTHRDCGNKTIDIPFVLDLPKIQEFCEKNNSVFLIKKHFYHRLETTDLKKYPNIFDVTRMDVDTQVLLSQTDVLVTDFSSCFNDFLALNKPIIFYAFDYDDYMNNERDYYWKYDVIKGGYTTKSKEELITALNSLSQDWDDTNHEDGRRQMRRVYFDDEVEMGTSRAKLVLTIKDMINGTYEPFDWSDKKATLG